MHFAALTAAGQTVLTEAKQVHAANLRLVFKDLSSGELADLDRLLDKLRTARLP